MGAAAHACDELAGEAPSLAVLLASRSHADEAANVLNAVQETVEPPRLIGCVAQAIVAGRREIEDEAAVAVWLASGLAAETFHLDFVRTGSGGLLAGYRFDPSAHDLHLLLPDPYRIPVEPARRAPQHRPAGNDRYGRRGERWAGTGRHPAVPRPRRAHLRHRRRAPARHARRPGRVAGLPADRLPVHRHRRRQRTDHRAGRPTAAAAPAWDRQVLPPDEQELVNHGLQIGIVVDEHVAVPGQGDFMIRGLLGADPSTGAIKIGEVVEVGATVQFQVRDAVGADKDLRLAVERAAAQLPGRPAGALLFTCTGRGRRMFGVADHDASTIEELLGGIPLAGFFAAGEIGPIAGRNALHGFTASMALFIEDAE